MMTLVGSMIFCALVAVAVGGFMHLSSGDATNPVVASAGAGFGLGLILYAFHSRE